MSAARDTEELQTFELITICVRLLQYGRLRRSNLSRHTSRFLFSYHVSASTISAVRLSNNNKWRWCVQADSQPKSSGLVLGRRPLGAVLHSSDEPGELSQWLCHDDITINIVLDIILYYYYYYYYKTYRLVQMSSISV